MRIVLRASIVHVLGLVGGLLRSLHAGVELAFPDRLTANSIRAAVAFSDKSTMLLGMPFHAGLLTADPRPDTIACPDGGYGVPLGSMYGMTELGVIATDLSGQLLTSPPLPCTCGLVGQRRRWMATSRWAR